MAIQKFILAGFVLFLTACANPLNQETYSRYLNEGAIAERQANPQLAEAAYSRALGNVYIGNLGPERESEALFNLGRMERLNGKFDLALEHLQKSLQIDENTNNAPIKIIKSTLGEIAMTLYEKGNIQQGITYLDRLSQLDGSIFYSEKSKDFISKLFLSYAKKLREQGNVEKANFYETMASK